MFSFVPAAVIGYLFALIGWLLGVGMTVIEFTVPEDRVGEWEMGCFEDDGAHYDDGMRGTVIVMAP